jgi:hypothetical protein
LAWKNGGYDPSKSGYRGYNLIYEASTQRLWVITDKTHLREGVGWRNLPEWFFTKKISESGPLQSYDPAEEILGWNGWNFKYLSIFRYSRVITEYAGTSPFDDMSSIKTFDPIAEKIDSEELNTWTDDEEVQHPIGDFIRFEDGHNSSWSFVIDAQKNAYATLSIYPDKDEESSVWDATFQRFARFTSVKPIEQPVPASSSPDGKKFTDFNDIVLIVVPFDESTGYKVIGSHWRIYRKPASGANAYHSSLANSTSTLIKEDVVKGNSSSYTVPKGTITNDGTYEWQMSYDLEYSISGSADTIKTATNWSDLTSFTVDTSVEPPIDPPSDSGGGCDTGAFTFLSLIGLVGAVALTRTSSRGKDR